MQSILCKLGFHAYKNVDIATCFTTEYSDRPSWGESKHIVYYQECDCCKKRRLKDNYKNEIVLGTRHDKHPGMERARVDWESNAIIYIGNGTKKQYSPHPQKSKSNKLKLIRGGKDT